MLPPFKILNANSVTDAVHELGRLGDQAKLYGGGTELLILLRHNLLRTEYLLNIKPIAELGQIRRETTRYASELRLRTGGWKRIQPFVTGCPCSPTPNRKLPIFASAVRERSEAICVSTTHTRIRPRRC